LRIAGKAKRLVLANSVRVAGIENLKPGLKVPADAEITLRDVPRFVGRGGLKIEHALEHFAIDPAGCTAADIGASTGGFTDCLLQRGAQKVYTLDVGTNQLAWKIRSDPRVIAREQYNCRHLSPDDLPELVDLIVIDVSFISLTLILGPAFSILKPGGDLLCLIKPQFELERKQVGKGGIIRDESLRAQAPEKIQRFVSEKLAKDWRGLTDSPITGTDGNHEYLAWLRNTSA
jgi:23S rRNA (cytidine1920-2'-O)/16S rRNA (cytidine1409-2'-O)-methyltransferase